MLGVEHDSESYSLKMLTPGGNPVSRSRTRVAVFASLAFLLCVAFAARVEAHAVLKSSSPALGSTVAGPDVPITLTFNVRIDAQRSKLKLLLPDNSEQDLPTGTQSAPDTLATTAKGLKPGEYRIRWQVLAPDGHISRGEIPFTVKTPDGH
jgi:copper resistance protein C